MHCPHCGTESSSEQKFCRRCGLGLEKFALTLAEQLPEGSGDYEVMARLLARQRRVEFWLSAAVMAFISLLVAAIFYALVVKIIIEKGQVVSGLIFLFVILLGLASVGLVVYNESLKEKLGKTPAREPAATPKEAATAKLLHESRIEPVPSVTERTTDLLAEARSARRES